MPTNNGPLLEVDISTSIGELSTCSNPGMGDMAMFLDWVLQTTRNHSLDIRPGRPRFSKSFKVFHPDVIHSPIPNGRVPQLLTIKWMIHSRYTSEATSTVVVIHGHITIQPGFRLQQRSGVSTIWFWNEEECKYDNRQLCMVNSLTGGFKDIDSTLTISH
ncbi:hypothetical protein Tco_1077072 [Tanacetum coccineum]